MCATMLKSASLSAPYVEGWYIDSELRGSLKKFTFKAYQFYDIFVLAKSQNVCEILYRNV